MIRHRLARWTLLALAWGSSGCSSCSADERADEAPRPNAPGATASAPPPGEASAVKPRISRREGQALVRAPVEKALYLADEDHRRLRRIVLDDLLVEPPALPPPPPRPDSFAPPKTAEPPAARFGDAVETMVELPGRPAQVFALEDRVLVTIRDPGLLMVFSAGETPKEIGRVSLPADAWGLAIAPDASAAYVTSAWTHAVTRVDLAKLAVDWTVDVPREPRGVSVSADGGVVYVSHLMGSALTKLALGAEVATKPTVERVELPPDPLRSIAGDKTVTASLGYALIHSPDGRRLFVARHALGSMWGWQGNPTVDVYSTVLGEPVAHSRSGRPYGQLTREMLDQGQFWADHAGTFIESSGNQWTQPRAMAYRDKTRHLLVASEAMALVVELDAMSVSPGVLGNRYYRLGGLPPEEPTKIQVPPHCGAPTGIALSEDEDVAWVYCRTTDNVAAVRLTPDGRRALRDEIEYLEAAAYHAKLSIWGPFAYARLALPPPSPDAADAERMALGRRLFFDGTEPVVSEGQGCAGCHPDGRDDGHVWREVLETASWRKHPHFRAGPTLSRKSFGEDEDAPFGFARQTPMLAGRVSRVGPYGWHAESPTLTRRIRDGFQLHRASDLSTDGKTLEDRAVPIALYLRDGLVPPPREERPLDEIETRGKEVFESPQTQCTTCHDPRTEHTDGNAVPLRGFKTPPLFSEDPNRAYKVPSLRFVAGTAPYYHDASAATLEELVDKNLDRMGHTTHLSADDRAALVAYLRTL
jgi:cytochrome c peroxidase